MPILLEKKSHLKTSGATSRQLIIRRPRFCNRLYLASRYTVILIATVIFGTIAMPSSPLAQDKKSKRPPMQVSIDAVISQSIKQTVPIIGRFVVRQAGIISALINGPVEEFRVEVGDRVVAGDIIAVLMNNTLKWRHELKKAEEEEFKAAVLTEKARLKLRRQELKRLEKLKESAAFSQARRNDKRQDVVVAESEAAEAVAKLASAQANRKLSEINLYNAYIRAPYSGVITKRHTEVGAYVKVGDPVADMINDQHLEIDAEVPSNRTSRLTPSLKIKAYINGSIPITATVRAVVPNENPQTRTRAVRFTPQLPAGIKNIANNQSITLHLPSNHQTSAVTVHKDAIISRKGITMVYLALSGKAQIRPVRVGDAVGSRFIVNSGLAPGDLVVVRGNERLRPGQSISYASPEKNKE